jgi:acyl transferase domain-containing protein
MAKRLAVSTALHSPAMASACAPFSQSLSALQFRVAEIPVYANDSALPFPAEPDSIRLQLGAALVRTVRFREMVGAMAQDGVATFVEVGPRATLTALAKSCLGEDNYRFIALDGRANEGLEALLLGLGRLALAGCRPDLEVFWRMAPLGAAPVVAGPMTVAVSGTNIGKPYPGAEFSSEQTPVQLEPEAEAP